MEIFRRKEESETRRLSLAMPMIDDKQDENKSNKRMDYLEFQA